MHKSYKMLKHQTYKAKRQFQAKPIDVLHVC